MASRPLTPRPPSTQANAVPRGQRGKTDIGATPVHLVDHGPAGPRASREEVDALLARHLGKHAVRIDRIDVHIHDESGPVGAPVARVVIRLAVSGIPSFVVSASAPDARAAVGAAVRNSERALRRRIERQRKRRA